MAREATSRRLSSRWGVLLSAQFAIVEIVSTGLGAGCYELWKLCVVGVVIAERYRELWDLITDREGQVKE